MSTPAIAVPGSIQRQLEKQPETPIQQQQRQDIFNLAYALWQQRGCPEGSPEQDWIEAERRVQGEQASTSPRR